MKKKLTKTFKPHDKRYDTQPVDTIENKILETFPYEYIGKDIVINITTNEFTTVCPWSGLPDFGTIKINYIPHKLIIELRSLKYYLMSYRNVGIYQEHAINRILQDLVDCCKPKWMQVTADYDIRGGIQTITSVEYHKKSTYKK